MNPALNTGSIASVEAAESTMHAPIHHRSGTPVLTAAGKVKSRRGDTRSLYRRHWPVDRPAGWLAGQPRLRQTLCVSIQPTKTVLAGVAVVAITMAAFWPVLDNSFVSWGD